MLYAKREKLKDKVYFQSFEGHTKDALLLLKYYFDQKRKTIDAFCNKWEIDIIKFKRNLFLAIALHDIGKLTQEFQNNIKAGKNSQHCPHPLFALPVLERIPFDNILDLPIPKLSILSHHSQLHNQIYTNYDIKNAHYLKKEIIEFCNNSIRTIFKDLEFDQNFVLPNINVRDLHDVKAADILSQYINPIKNDYIIDYFDDTPCYDKAKAIFTYFFSILQLCDDYSSANFSEYIENQDDLIKNNYSAVLTDPDKYIYKLEFSISKFKSILFKNYDLYPFQKSLAGKKEKNCFLFAPCGRGKTEGALWWAYNLRAELDTDRIIFALPTQVTCNAMYKRFIEIYGLSEKLVGLYHGRSALALEYLSKQKNKEINQDYVEQKDTQKIRDAQFMGNTFFKPITITTIDHLAYSFVHGFSQADFASGNIQNSIIIFDEIHYYEQYTLEILLSLFEKFRLQKIPHLLMTGTAPQFIINTLNQFSNKYKIIQDDEGLQFKPFIIKKAKNDQEIETQQVFQDIKEEYLKNKNIFVILNRVDWAQSFFSNLKNYLKIEGFPDVKVILYHSRFIYKHRMQKEQEIEDINFSSEKVIIVATQVIEISLDISCDIMFSQIAPLDAIGQRAGRLNRSGKQPYKNGMAYELRLFNISDYLPYDDELIIKSWDNVAESEISYKDIKVFCDKIYGDLELEKNIQYLNFFKDNIFFGRYYKNVANDDEGKALKIRESKFQTVNVIPSEFMEVVSNSCVNSIEYMCKIPFYLLQYFPNAFKIVEDSKGYTQIISYLKYSYAKGIEKSNMLLDFDDRCF